MAFLFLSSSHLSYSFNKTDNIAPGKSYVKTPLRIDFKKYSDLFLDEYKEKYAPVDLNLSFGVERRFHSSVLGETMSVGTSVLIPMYKRFQELSDLYALPGEFQNKIAEPKIIQMGVNFKLFF